MKKPLLYVFSVVTSLCFFISPSKSRADEIRYIATGESALMEMAQIINKAQHTIDLTYFILDPCTPSGKVLLSLLINKSVKEKVRVRILIDAFTHSWDTRRHFASFLHQKGIEVRYFNARAEFNPKITFRSHVKLLLVDGKEYISGGRNIAEDYFSLAEGLNFIDRDIYVKGASAAQAQDGFDRLWNSPYTQAGYMVKPLFLNRWLGACFKWTTAETNLLETIRRRSSKVVSSNKTVQCSNVEFVMDDASFADYLSGLPIDSYMTKEKLAKKHSTRELIRLIDDTHSILTLENWSYDPWGEMRASIASLRKKNIPIFVITNRVTDVGGSMDYRNIVGVNRDNGGSQNIRTLSYKGSMDDSWDRTPKASFFMIHSKVFVTDDKTTAITSYNLDARSYHFNLESAVIARNCPAFADIVLRKFAQLNENFDKDQSCAECQRKPSFKFFDRLKAILGASYY